MSRSSKLAPAATKAQQIAAILAEVNTLSEKRRTQNDAKSKSKFAGLFSAETPQEIKARRDKDYLKELRKLLDKATTIAITQGIIDTNCSEALQSIVAKATQTLGERNQDLKQNVEASFALRGSQTLPPEYINILSGSIQMEQKEKAITKTEDVAKKMAQSIAANLQEGQEKIVAAFDVEAFNGLDNAQINSFFQFFAASLKKLTKLPINILIEPKGDKNLNLATKITDDLNSFLDDPSSAFGSSDEVKTIDGSQRSLLIGKEYLYINSISENNVLEITGAKRFKEPFFRDPKKTQPAWQITEADRDSVGEFAAAAASSQYGSARSVGAQSAGGQSVNGVQFASSSTIGSGKEMTGPSVDFNASSQYGSARSVEAKSTSAHSIYDNMQGLQNDPDFEEDSQLDQDEEQARYAAITKERELAEKAQELNNEFFADLSDSLKSENAAKITIFEDGTASHVPALVLDISDMLDVYDQNKSRAIATLKTTGELTAKRVDKDGVEKPWNAFYYLEPNSYEQLVRLIRTTVNNDPFFRIIIKGQTQAETDGYYNLVCKLIEDEQTIMSNALGRKSSETFGVGIDASDIIDGVMLKMTPELEKELAEQNSFGKICPQVDNFVALGDYETIEYAAAIPTYSQVAKKQPEKKTGVAAQDPVYAELDTTKLVVGKKNKNSVVARPAETVYAKIDVVKTEKLKNGMRALEEASEVDDKSGDSQDSSLNAIASSAKQLAQSSQAQLQQLSEQQHSSSSAIFGSASSGYGSTAPLASENNLGTGSDFAGKKAESLPQTDSQNGSNYNLPQTNIGAEKFVDLRVESFYKALESQARLVPDLWIIKEGETKSGEKDGSIFYITTKATENGEFLQYRIVPNRMLGNNAVRYMHATTAEISIGRNSPALDDERITTEIENCERYTELYTQSQESVVDDEEELPLPPPPPTSPRAVAAKKDTSREAKIQTVQDLISSLSQSEKLSSRGNIASRTFSVKNNVDGKFEEIMTISRDRASQEIISIKIKLSNSESVDVLANEDAYKTLINKMTSALDDQQGKRSPSPVAKDPRGGAEQLSSTSSLEKNSSSPSFP